jgi:hypothetical protein
VLSFERELRQFEGTGRLQALERRDVFSIYPELRALSWAGAMLIAAGVSVLVSKNFDRIGPVVLAGAVAFAAAACYAYTGWRRHAGRESLADDFVLLLGALLLSADLAYVESQFHLLDRGWPRHFLILALAHGACAYLYESRVLIALSISALAAWMGVEQRPETVFDASVETAVRAFLCAGVVAVWRAGNRKEAFERVFDHFIANLLLFGALVLTFQSGTRPLGTLLTLIAAAAVIAFGFRKRSEVFILYAYVYGVIAVDVFVVDLIETNTEAVLLFLIGSTIAAIAGLFVLHARFRKS